jgi:ornithine cyclodeaminase
MAAQAMIFVSAAQALDRLSFKLACTAAEQALVAAADGTGYLNPVVIARGLNDGEIFSIKSGASAERRVLGLKVGSYWPGNEAKGLAAHGSVVLLLDPETGRLMAVVDTSEVNRLRTAAADAVAASVLARPDSSTLTLIGAGHQGEYEAQALCRVLPITRIFIVNRDRARAQRLGQKLSNELGICVHVSDVEQGCREADVLVTATASRAPLFESQWLKPGTYVASMGSDQAGKQELPPDLLRRARLFCDLPPQSLSIGEFQHVREEIDAGVTALTAIGDVLAGRASGRIDAQEIIVFDSSGLALQDLFVAASLLHAEPAGVVQCQS